MKIDYGKKGYKIAVFALVIALLAFSVSGNITTITNVTNQTVGLNMVLNTTNLAPTIELDEPGTGERVDNVTYWTNNSDIEVHAYAHAMNVSQTAGAFLYINNTLYSPRAGRPLGGAEIAYRGVDVVIPRYSYYRVDFENYHHYVWRETKILSGNFTSNITSSCSGCVNQIQLDEKINKSGDKLTGALYSSNNFTNFINLSYLDQLVLRSTDNITGENTIFAMSPHYITFEVDNGGTTLINQSSGNILYQINGSEEYSFNSTSLDMHNNTLTNCSNCQVTGHGLARAYLNGSQLNLTSGLLTHVNLNNESFDPYNEFNTTSGNYTVPEDGYYDVFASITYKDVTAPYGYVIEIRDNGSLLNYVEVHSSFSDFISPHLSDTWFLQKGHQLGLYAVYSAPGNAADIDGSAKSSTWMSVSLKSKVPP